MDMTLERIRAGVIDGRARTPRHIQKQLTILHDALVRATTSILQVIVQDTGCSSSEAWSEINMTMRAVKQQFSAINFRDTIDREYSLAHGKDNPSRRTAYGCAYIIPARHTRLFSTVQPIAAAIAAGNCIVVEVQQTLSEVDRLLRKILTPVMDKDTFLFVEQRPQPGKFFSEQVVVIGDSSIDAFSPAKTILSSPQRVIAVVDRSADISRAAREIVRARFRFGGKSPYAPDIVFVNEFALKAFCQAAVRFLTEELSESVTANGSTQIPRQGTTTTAQKELQRADTTILVSGSRGSIHLLKQRSDSVLNMKINEPALIVYATTSLDDAIDTANGEKCLLAAYFFAEPHAAKYLSQFIASDATFSNHIPSRLLVGPAAPKGFPVSLSSRFTTDMFSTPNPEIINPSIEDQDLADFLDSLPDKATIVKLRSEIEQPLPDMGEPTTTTVGFFEQGLFTGLAVESALLLSTVGICAFYAVPAILRRIRS